MGFFGFSETVAAINCGYKHNEKHWKKAEIGTAQVVH